MTKSPWPIIKVPYRGAGDAPKPVRQKIREAHAAGATTGQLAELFSMPDEWIRLFVNETPEIN